MSGDYESMVKRIQDLEKENRYLLTMLEAHGISYEKAAEVQTEVTSSCQITEPVIELGEKTCTVTRSSSMAEKAALFIELFHGRTDVYAKQWKKDDKIGYSPV